MWPNPLLTAGLVTLNSEIFNGKLHFLHSASGISNHKEIEKLQLRFSLYLYFCYYGDFSTPNNEFLQINLNLNQT